MFFVGRSTRTNEAGVRALAAAFPDHQVVSVDVGPLLHLKSACSALDDGTVIAAAGCFAPGAFGDARVVEIPAEDALAANLVARGRRAVMAAGHPRARALVERAGCEVRELDTSEFRKADGALTCLSILL
jgi:dimethylargininase